VLSPLLQALVASSDETTAALAMKFLAAQARFGQAQRRMRLALAAFFGVLIDAVQVLAMLLALAALLLSAGKPQITRA
jgi:hypothetical protein